MAETRTPAPPAPDAPIRALEMVREIRDAFYERTRDLEPDELRAFIAREAAAVGGEPERHADAAGRSSAA